MEALEFIDVVNLLEAGRSTVGNTDIVPATYIPSSLVGANIARPDKHWLASTIAATVFHYLTLDLTEEGTVAVHSAVHQAVLEVLSLRDEEDANYE